MSRAYHHWTEAELRMFAYASNAEIMSATGLSSEAVRSMRMRVEAFVPYLKPTPKPPPDRTMRMLGLMDRIEHLRRNA